MSTLSVLSSTDGDSVIDIPQCFSSEESSAVEEVPPYSADVMLRPVNAFQNLRYDRNFLIRPGNVDIPAGLHSSMYLPEPIYLPQGWTLQVHPEGSPYYVNALKVPCVVTDTPLHDPELCSKLTSSIEVFHYNVKNLDLTLPSDCELYVHVDSTHDGCSYYLVDHDCQTIFWLQTMDSDTLGLPEVSSISHLRYVLHEQYWTHVDYFPHRPVAPRLRQELMSILRHARGDHLTSENSTFPYDAEQCAMYIDLLNIEADCTTYMTCVIARIWELVSRHRYQHFYGEDYSRLYRGQRRLELPRAEGSILTKLRSYFLFGLPGRTKCELEMLFTDRLVFRVDWQKFQRSLALEWRESALLSVGLLVTNSCFFALPRNFASSCAGLSSLILSLSGLATSVALLRWQSGSMDLDASSIAELMQNIQHAKLGFEPIAAVFSIPRALVYWSMLFSAAHLVAVVAEMTGLVEKIVMLVIVALVGFVLCRMAIVLRGAPIEKTVAP
ncbi:hypothetical protein BKA93DRAFT_756917 [Sparassis latifolia]